MDSRSGTPLDLTGLSNGAGPAMTGLQTVVRLYYRTARAPFLSVRSVSTKKEDPRRQPEVLTYRLASEFFTALF